MLRFKRWLKHVFYHENLFEHMGIRYLGPIDGNDLHSLQSVLQYAKHLESSVILHVKTTKGKGYAPAESDPDIYHSLPPKSGPRPVFTFSGAMGDTLCRLAADDDRICAVTAAMRDGTGLSTFAEHCPRRFFDVGIAEGHALTFAAGLAAGGRRPVVALYSTFLQRAFDNLLHDAALQKLPVTLCIDRAGLNAGDGPTHYGVFDVALLGALPGVRIFAPVTFAGLDRALKAALDYNGVAAVRYPSGAPDPALSAFYPNGEAGLAIGVRQLDLGQDPQVTLVTHGRVAAEGLRAAKDLESEGVRTRILLCEYLAPFGELAAEIAPRLAGNVLFLEEEIRAGGFGMNLRDALDRADALNGRCEIMALDNAFIAPVKGQTPLQAAGLDAARIKETLRRLATEEGEDHA